MSAVTPAPNIRTQLFLLTLCVLLPVLGFAAYVSYLLVQQDRQSIERGAMQRTRALMTAIDAELRGSVTSLQLLATSQALDKGDLRAFHAEARRALASQPDWLTITLWAPPGVQVLNALAPLDRPLPPAIDRRSIEQVFKTGRPAIGSVGTGAILQAPAVPVRVPVTRNGQVAFVLAAGVKPSSFEAMLISQNPPPGWVNGLVDGSGRFIARVPPREVGSLASAAYRAEVAKAPQGWFHGATVEGLDTYTAFYRSEFSDWSIGFAIPASVVDAGVRRSSWLLGLGALGAILLAFFVAALIGRRISGPLVSLAASARAIGRGEAVETAPAARVREISVVADALQEAGSAVRAQRQRDEKEKEDLVTADRAKDQFIAMLSHEMRNPLAALSAAAQVLKHTDPSRESAARARGVVERQVAHMTHLVEDLLDINRVVMGKVALAREPLDLALVAAEVIRSWREAGRFASHRVELETLPARVHADRSRLEQIISNLLDNAVKFTPTGKAIHVWVAVHRGEAVLTVADEGEGIPREAVDSMFDLFVQGPQGLDRRSGGLGIGLALVRRLVELHGGTVAAASDGIGRGARFTVRLPLAQPQADSLSTATAAPGNGKQRRASILVVEDNDDAREMLTTMLLMDGHKVRSARDGAEALALAAAEAPEVMIVDVGLPDMNGHEVAGRVRAQTWGARVRLLALTGYGQPEDRERALAAGFDDHLTKPVEDGRLARLIAAAHR
jgi:signal transduction histidine kinase/CheY-like chemotaxis protein